MSIKILEEEYINDEECYTKTTHPNVFYDWIGENPTIFLEDCVLLFYGKERLSKAEQVADVLSKNGIKLYQHDTFKEETEE